MNKEIKYFFNHIPSTYIIKLEITLHYFSSPVNLWSQPAWRMEWCLPPRFPSSRSITDSGWLLPEGMWLCTVLAWLTSLFIKLRIYFAVQIKQNRDLPICPVPANTSCRSQNLSSCLRPFLAPKGPHLLGFCFSVATARGDIQNI